LSNSSQTGLIDTLVVQQKLLENMVFMDNYYDVGGTFLLYIPKSIVQSMYKAEKYVLMAVDRLKAGDFDDNLLQAVIMNMSKEDIQNMENSNFRLSRIIDSYMSETTIDQIKIENEAVQSISKQDIIRVANKYFGNDYLSFHSKIGFPKKTKLDKPKITPIDPKNKNEKSVMAQRIEKMNSEPIVPKYIDYTSDVIFSDIRQNLHYYQTRNPLNDIFSLNIRFAKGILEEPQLEQLAYYLGHIGTSEQSYTDFARSLQLLGSSISFEVDNDYFTIHIDGFERNLSPTLRSLSQLLKAPKNEASVIKKMVKDEKLNLRLMKKDLNTKMEILQSYALYGSQSEYLNRLTAKEIKKLKHEDFLGLLTRLWSTETFVHFVGNKQESEIKAMIIDYLPFNELIQKSTSPIVRDLPKLNYHKVNFLEDKKAVQTHLRINTISSKLTEADRYLAPVFNYYFGLGMNSLMFREAREYRSLAYGAWGYYKVPYLFHKAGYLMAGMSTQADKTNEALQLLVTLVDTMPFYEEQMSSLKNFMLKSFNTQLPTFRSISYQVQKWNMQGYKTDPSTIAYPIYQNMNMEDIKSFYFSNVSNRYHIINLIGDSKRFDLEKVKQYGEFKTLKLKEILKY
jgi:predicted Zn-dependent peptidase